MGMKIKRGGKMLTHERQREICRIVDEKGAVTAAELKTILGASESTIRRDLNELAAKGLINKVFGGATSRKDNDFTLRDDEMSLRRGICREEKLKIARYAAEIVVPGDFIFIDAGTTTELMVDYISCPDVRFVTNSLTTAQKLGERGYETYLTGGQLKPVTGALVGAGAVEDLERYNFTKGFFGTNGISTSGGFSTPEIAEGAVKRKAMERSNKCYILADQSKFGRSAPCCFGALHDAEIITSRLPDEVYRNKTNITEVDML